MIEFITDTLPTTHDEVMDYIMDKVSIYGGLPVDELTLLCLDLDRELVKSAYQTLKQQGKVRRVFSLTKDTDVVISLVNAVY